MSTGERDDYDASTATDLEGEGEERPEPKRKLDIEVEISDAGPCRKRLKVVVPRAEVDRQFEESLGTIGKDAVVPGFRKGHAPRQLLERRYRKEVAGQVKSALLMACMEQLDEDYELNPISQPQLDLEAIELPEDGPMQFEMELEVQPDFDLPAYKALTVRRPTKTITEADVDAQLQSYLERHAQLVPKLDGAAEKGDIVVANITFRRNDGITHEAKEVQFRLLPELRLQDGRIPDLDLALQGARPGDHREATMVFGTSVPDPVLRGQSIPVSFEVLDLKYLRLPEVNAAFLNGLGFRDLDEFRQALRELLERRLAYQQREAIRREIFDQLSGEIPFDLPPDLVARQENMNLRRRVMELRDAGFSDNEIRAREADLRANAREATLRSLREFFLLSRIAEAEGIKVEDADLQDEIEAIAERTDESPRRIRARIQKEGLGEALAAQILERKTISRILEYVKLEDVPLVEEAAAETLDQSAAPAPDQPEEAAAPAPADQPEAAGNPTPA